MLIEKRISLSNSKYTDSLLKSEDGFLHTMRKSDRLETGDWTSV